MKYYIIAGEASGDLHGANLIRAIKKKDPEAEFCCWGGDQMAGEGVKLVKHFRDLAFMGFVEVVMNLKTILANLRFCKEDIKAFDPDVVVLIDYPGFNLRIAEFAHLQKIKVVYYVSPQVWAWKQSRVRKIRRTVDRMLCILPFESEFYGRLNYSVDFVGHPLIDAIQGRKEFDIVRRKEELGLNQKPVIALLPGSRKQEIASMLPVMLQAGEAFKDYQLVVAGAPSQDKEFYNDLTKGTNASVVQNRTYDILEISDAALVTSGTATLEAALFGVPEVVCYKGNWVSYWIARQLVKIDYISLVNLIAGKELVKELIQSEMNVKNLRRELKKCLDKDSRDEIRRGYEELLQKLGGAGASEKAARIVIEEARHEK